MDVNVIFGGHES
jgi:hypothetical protein